ncbi:5257_t:CDS:1, partial [Entrophospora sp. SA101]
SLKEEYENLKIKLEEYYNDIMNVAKKYFTRNINKTSRNFKKLYDQHEKICA